MSCRARTRCLVAVVATLIEAAEGGEPPGRWWGPGTEALGFRPGQLIEREPYELLFSHRQAPDGKQVGRQRPGGPSTAELYVRLLAAEPYATCERKRESLVEAAARARRSPLYFDLTISFSKSISIFHATPGENARQASRAGDTEACQWHEADLAVAHWFAAHVAGR
jgi:TrwC relaxase